MKRTLTDIYENDRPTYKRIVREVAFRIFQEGKRVLHNYDYEHDDLILPYPNTHAEAVEKNITQYNIHEISPYIHHYHGAVLRVLGYLKTKGRLPDSDLVIDYCGNELFAMGLNIYGEVV